ncbi:methyltransferase domain-containing protein [Colletotrichum navitas]|uniref:Methyltransferase domain-containing protein n=1 Tax=Colletotrichum navitas TaxID=681940 RepID=A0AAD8QBJ2_9PEZI|nr:methyltransferase domain-containing protein [Colletotrichum navitas]KAK1599521.1 methyltransferase domain-containing protein [Colletotrichum navitas]
MTKPAPNGMASWTSTIYSLNRGSVEDELERLAYNHFNIWTPLTDGLLPAHILSSLQSQDRPRIADIATGSGVWLTTLADDVPPRSELIGFDLDRLKLPPRPPTPPIPPPPVSPPLRPEQPTLDFREQDVLKPFPAELRGTFDLVHVRLLALGLKAGDWDAVLRRLYDLLKPGGWLVWEDTGGLYMAAFPPSRAYDEFWWATMKHDAKEKSTKATLQLLKPSLTAVVEDGGEETVRTMEDVSRIERDLVRDTDQNGVRLGFDYFWNWGQRPS